ncbi:50S ribosomal protein L13 [Methanonatronarchaeum sp. AMET6-2]|uniref:50S ribosomal protein L13 n=1 Tax=Methanonatronarchaeum sp. AMET6-2 TaxID=2933293 RepID=UPI0012118312|nr:50S ribosomal protein L13 [Methanonatronarchaeum sp. AMET6-2]RZN61899.1 MAG: 50S ribosomal protein L13 [Methanonatronarchaeia archaeon]UOY10630.1 50S ribosomal protein L13 [Methanonatronarchaeum sp. AMET6-2]
MKIIDADGAILGRLATEVSKRALEGEEIVVVNAEKTAVTGNKDQIFQKYKERYDRGSKDWGPHYPRTPDRIVKRTIKSMLPKKARGKEALKKIEVNMGIPIEYEDTEFNNLEIKYVDELRGNNYIRIEDISRYLGWS